MGSFPQVGLKLKNIWINETTTQIMGVFVNLPNTKRIISRFPLQPEWFWMDFWCIVCLASTSTRFKHNVASTPEVLTNSPWKNHACKTFFSFFGAFRPTGLGAGLWNPSREVPNASTLFRSIPSCCKNFWNQHQPPTSFRGSPVLEFQGFRIWGQGFGIRFHTGVVRGRTSPKNAVN